MIYEIGYSINGTDSDGNAADYIAAGEHYEIDGYDDIAAYCRDNDLTVIRAADDCYGQRPGLSYVWAIDAEGDRCLLAE